MSAARASMQAGRLLATLMRLPKPDVILVQNPPAAPTLAVVVAGCADARRAARDRLAQPVAHHPRGATGRASSRGSCARPAASVAGDGVRMRIWPCRKALADWLHREWKINATVLYDRPAAFFAKPSARSQRTSCGSGWRAIIISARAASRSSCARRAGRRTRISICCSKRSSVPSGR